MPGLWARLQRHEPGHLRVGRLGERAAERFLRKNRYRVLERNTRLPAGELDLVCLAPDRITVVIVEVKARTLSPGSPVERFMPEMHITQSKRAKLRSLTHSLRQSRGWLDRPIRIDVIAVDLPPKGRRSLRRILHRSRPEVRHYVNAV